MSREEYNGVRSTIIDETTPPPDGNISRTSTFIYGVASQGPIGQPTWVNGSNVKTIFGDVPLDASFDMSLVRGYYEYANSCKSTPDVALIRCGNVNAASVSLYENNYVSSGDLAYSLVQNSLGVNVPAESLWIRAVSQGSEYNGAMTKVTEDDNGFPTYLRVELPDGAVAGFNLSHTPGAPGVVSRVSDLVNRINNHQSLSGKVYAGYSPLQKTVDLTVTTMSGTTDSPELSYELAPVDGSANESWGNKILSIVEAYREEDVALSIEVGALNAEFETVPQKNMTAGTSTIDMFVRESSLETVLSVTAAYVGASSVERALYCSTVDGWDYGYSIAGSALHNWTFQLYVKRSGSTERVLLTMYNESTEPNGKYTINATTGKVTIRETLSLGDVYYASYRYKVAYAEAKLRSDLLIGSDRSYFIYGDQVIFGAEQPANVYAYYNSKVFFESGDISITNAETGEIEFTNASMMPAVGESITLVINYEPELPAASGKVLTGNVVQPGSLSGGKDGRNISKRDYVKVVKQAFESVDLYPRKNNIVMGMWLDEVVSGYNSETGLAEDLPLNMHADILPYVDRASNFTGECVLEIPVKPPLTLDQATQNEWIQRLTENSDTDLNRPANIIDAINNFRAEAPLGVLVGAIPEINDGRRYYMNPACVYAAYKSDLKYTESATHGYVPGNVLDLGVKIFNAETQGKLNVKRYTTAAINYRGQFIWADAPTLAIRTRSQFDRQFVRDTTYLAVNMAREVAEKYIGKPRLSQYLLSLKKDVGKAVEFLVPDVLSDFYIEIIPYADGHITGRTGIRMRLMTAKEIRIIDIITSVALSSQLIAA